MSEQPVYCDRCPQRAAVEVVLSSGMILALCGHHYTANQAALSEGGALVAAVGAGESVAASMRAGE